MGSMVPFPEAVRDRVWQVLRDLPPIVVLSALAGLILASLISGYFLLHLLAHHPRHPRPSETQYITTTPSGEPSDPSPLPDVFTTPVTDSIQISLVIPAYNETSRLPIMLSEAISHLSTTLPPNSWEILIVDDGSTDQTIPTALKFYSSLLPTSPNLRLDQLRCIHLTQNRGKGGAVTHGMRHIRGKYAIFADADGATRFSDLAALLKRLEEVETPDGYGIAVGSRAHMVHTDAVVKRSFIRNFLMYSFHTLLKTVGVREIGDTQCGFKLFTRKAVQVVFKDLRTEGWIFDIEILLLARYKGIPVVEVPVNWHEVEGTKLNLVKDSLRMAWDLGIVRIAYAVGVYKIGPGGPGRGEETKKEL